MGFEFTGDFRSRYNSTAIIMGLIGVASVIYMSIQHNHEWEQSSLERKIIKFIDEDSNGLSFQENYQIKQLMGVQDSSINYIPSLEDWKRVSEEINK
jgi:hypothetical protein